MTAKKWKRSPAAAKRQREASIEKDPERAKQWQRDFYARNKAARLAKAARYKAAHRDELNAKKKRLRAIEKHVIEAGVTAGIEFEAREKKRGAA